LNHALRRYLSADPRVRRIKPVQLRPQRRVDRRLGNETVTRLTAEYLDGATSRVLAARYGISKTAVVHLVREAHIAVRHPRLSEADITRVITLYRQGLRQTEIALRIGRSPGAVWHVLGRAGLV
jgi:predicted DNA-binding protein (UPF0251 family)